MPIISSQIQVQDSKSLESKTEISNDVNNPLIEISDVITKTPDDEKSAKAVTEKIDCVIVEEVKEEKVKKDEGTIMDIEKDSEKKEVVLEKKLQEIDVIQVEEKVNSLIIIEEAPSKEIQAKPEEQKTSLKEKSPIEVKVVSI